MVIFDDFVHEDNVDLPLNGEHPLNNTFYLFEIKKTKSGDRVGLQWATLPSTQHRGGLQACLLEHGDAEVDPETNVL